MRVREKLLPLVNISDVLGMESKYYMAHTNKDMVDRRKNIIDRRQGGVDEGESENTAEFLDNRREENSDRRKSWRSDINVVVLKIGLNSFGLIVDMLFDNEEIVVKPLSTHIKDCKCFAGATIMGDGRVAMILDALGIAEYSKLNFIEVNAEEFRRQQAEERLRRSSSDHRESVLLFNFAYNEHYAISLDCVSRLEKILPTDIHQIGERKFIEYQDISIPLIQLDDVLPVNSFPDELEEYFVIIPKTQQEPVGIAVSRILDAIDISVDIKHDNTTPYGLLGSAFVNGELTMFLNNEELLELIYNKIPSSMPH